MKKCLLSLFLGISTFCFAAAPNADTPVSALMVKKVIVATPDEPLGQVASDLRKAGIDELPVVDSEQHVQGMITSRKLAELAVSNPRWPTFTVDKFIEPAYTILLDAKLQTLRYNDTAFVVNRANELQGVISASDVFAGNGSE